MIESAATIRIARPDDEAGVTALLGAAYAVLDDGQYDRERLVAAMPVMAHANPKLLASGKYFVAEVGSDMAACGGWSVEQPGTGEIIDGVGHIRHFATHPAFLRRGIARLLLDRCIQEATASGMQLLKSQSTLQAENFYAAAGFRRICIFDVRMGKGISLPGVDMERDLP